MNGSSLITIFLPFTVESKPLYKIQTIQLIIIFNKYFIFYSFENFQCAFRLVLTTFVRSKLINNNLI